MCRKALKGFGRYLVYTYRQLFESFRGLDKRFFLISLYDILFLLSAMIVFIITSGLLGRAIQLPSLQSAAMLEIYMLPGILLMLAVWAVLTFAGVVLAQTVFKGLIWTTIIGKRFTRRYFNSLFWVNVLWFILWGIPSLLIYYGTKPDLKEIVQPAYFLLIFHFTVMLYTVFTQKSAMKGAIKKSISSALSVGARKVRHFIIPYVYAIIIYVIISRIFKVVNISTKFGMFVAIIITIFFIAWLRLYIYSVAEKAVE